MSRKFVASTNESPSYIVVGVVDVCNQLVASRLGCMSDEGQNRFGGLTQEKGTL